MGTYGQCLGIMVLVVASGMAMANPTSAPVNVISVRPHLNGNVYIQAASQAMCGTEVYMLEGSLPGFREMYSAVLAAMMAGKKVAFEARVATGCTGWGTKLESVTAFPN